MSYIHDLVHRLNTSVTLDPKVWRTVRWPEVVSPWTLWETTNGTITNALSNMSNVVLCLLYCLVCILREDGMWVRLPCDFVRWEASMQQASYNRPRTHIASFERELDSKWGLLPFVARTTWMKRRIRTHLCYYCWFVCLVVSCARLMSIVFFMM